MNNNTEVIKKYLETKEDLNEKLTKKDCDIRVANWQLFYLNNLDIFNEEYLDIKLHYFQKTILNDCVQNDVIDIIASRGLSKSFTIALLATDLALLLPNIQIGISAKTYGQSNKIINEKIDALLTSKNRGISPMLKKLRQEGYIIFKNSDIGDGRVVEFDNGSRIFSICCGENGRGSRTNISILDESALVTKTDYYRIIEPMLEPYNYNGLYLEPKQILMTSARNKQNWMWKHLVDCVNGHYKDKRIKYSFFCGDIFTAVANKIQSVNQYISRRKSTDELSFEQEYLNIFLGTSENSLYNFTDFEKNQVLHKAFYPVTPQQKMRGEKIKRKFYDNEVRILAWDIAASSGSENDNTTYILMSVNKETNRKKLEYICVMNGINTVQQVVYAKRLFYDYKCSYVIPDTKGVGLSVYDMLTMETYDEEMGVTYPAWNVCLDKKLQISSDTVIQDKIDRQMKVGQEVVVPYAGTLDLNSQMHFALRTAIREENIDFLIATEDKRIEFEDKDDKWLLKSAEEKAYLLAPFENTKAMINEATSLESTFTENQQLKVKEQKRTDTKDRYMTLGMANLLCDKIYAKYTKESQEEDFNLDDWDFLSGNYDNNADLDYYGTEQDIIDDIGIFY